MGEPSLAVYNMDAAFCGAITAITGDRHPCESAPSAVEATKLIRGFTASAEELVDKVGAAHAAEGGDEGAALVGLVPEEELALGCLLLGCAGAVEGSQGVGVEAGVPRLGADGHGRGREVLHLLEVEVEAAGDDGELGHVLLGAAGVAADEIGYELLVEARLAADAVEVALEGLELAEGGLAHDLQHSVGGMLGGHLEAAADVAGDELAGVGFLVGTGQEEQVVADAAADEAFLDAGHGVDGAVEVEEEPVVGVEVTAGGGMEARGATAALAEGAVAAAHAVHVGRGSAEVAEVALEVGHLRHGTHLAQDALLAAADNLLALVGGDGAEGAAAEAAAVDGDGVAYHLVGWDALVLVAGMG